MLDGRIGFVDALCLMLDAGWLVLGAWSLMLEACTPAWQEAAPVCGYCFVQVNEGCPPFWMGLASVQASIIQASSIKHQVPSNSCPKRVYDTLIS